MSLFVVNRYQGNEDSLPDSTNSDDHLTALLKKIEERKKRKSTTDEKEVNNEACQTSKVQVPRKKRKKHNKVFIQGDIATENKTKETVKSPIEKSITDSAVQLNDNNVSNKLQESIKNAGNSKEKSASKKQQDFVILGSDSHKKKPSVKRVLPTWLLKPEIISADINNGPPLSDFKYVLDEKLIDILKGSGMTKLFPVQASTIPWILECDKHRKANWWPQDACISAPTGSGKTLAYVLPIVQQLQYRNIRKVRCLVVLPVQELAAQVYKVMETYTAHTDLRVALLSGAAAFQQEQLKLVKKFESGKYASRVDIIVTTPGRLIDHIERTPGFSLASLRFLVIDEADRATDWLQHLPAPHSSPGPRNVTNIKSSSNRPAQKLLFSATLSQDPEKLSRLELFQPKLFTVIPEDKDNDFNLDDNNGDFAGRYTSPGELVERAVECEALYKPLALYQLLTENDEPKSTLVFANSGQMAYKLALLIRTLGKSRGLTVAAISALLSPNKREHVLSEFSQGKIQVLISSDALARGMDIPGVNLVVSYDLPKHIKGYIHRSGRTGRAGNAGVAVSLLTSVQAAAFSRMLTAARKTVPKIEKKDLDSFAALVDYESHIDKVKEILIKEETEAVNSLKAVKRKHRKPSGR